MGDLTKNLSASEFACDCDYADCKAKLAADMHLALAIQDAVDYFEGMIGVTRAAVYIADGNRCKPNNIDIQMKWANKTREQAELSGSKHMYFIAADFKIKIMLNGQWEYVHPIDIYNYLDKKYPDSCGIGLYDNRVHLDMRKRAGRWKA